MSYANIELRRTPAWIQYLSDLMKFRHLCWNLAASDLRSRFRRSYLGIIWAIIQPLAFSLVVAAVWGTLFQESNYLDFALYVFSGMVIWEYFSNLVMASQDSLMASEGYLKQTRIPFLIFQARTPLTGLVVMLCGSTGLVVLLIGLGKMPDPGLHLLLVPAFFAVIFLFAMPLAIVLSVMGAHFRDLKHISQIVVQGLFFLSPVMLGREILQQPELYFMNFVNPMVPLLDLYRAPLLYGTEWDLQDFYVLGGWTLALWLLAGLVSARVGRRLIFAL